MVLPLAAAGVAGFEFWRILHNMGDGSYDPRAIDTPILGHKVPDFTLPGVVGGPGFSMTDLQDIPHPILINFFASWCIPCVAEMAALRSISQKIPIWGVAYKDKPTDATSFLARDGNPYARTASDYAGMTAIDWGVTGVPETFLIVPGGYIRWHSANGLTEEIFQHDIRPRMGKL